MTEFPFVKYNKSIFCDVCHFAKQKRLSFPISKYKSKKCFELIHVDVWGPYSIPSIHVHKYFLTIVDDYLRYTWIFLLKQKFEVLKTLENFVVFVQTQFKTTIKIIIIDNGTEYLMTNLFVNKGIVHETSCVNTSQQNSIVERKQGHISNVSIVLLIKSHLSKNYWSYFVIHVAHIINMLPTPVLNYSSPHEMRYKTTGDFNRSKVFGSLCYVSTLSTNKKNDPRASKCVFIGFKRGTKGCVLLNI